jgi:hypothetical protein
MATHPYISGASNVEKMIGNLKKNFPATVTSDTVKRFGLAPRNESSVINALQFIGLIDEEGKRTQRGHDVMIIQDETAFKKAFGDLIKDAYKELFDVWGDAAWTLPKLDLIGNFRAADKTSEVIGTRQANLFTTFAALAGHGEVPAPKTKAMGGAKKTAKSSKAKSEQKTTQIVEPPTGESPEGKGKTGRDMALTVRIEINLPAEGTQETYDNIFKSIKVNLIDD